MTTMPTTPEIDAAVAELRAAEAAHAELLVIALRAIGKRVGVDYVKRFDDVTEAKIDAAHQRVQAAQKALDKAELSLRLRR